MNADSKNFQLFGKEGTEIYYCLDVAAEHGEGLQILHYEFGQKYEPHLDYFNDPHNTKNGGQRTATMLMYL